MYKIAAMGDKNSIYGFASLGIMIYPVDDSVQAVKTIRNLADNGYAVIFITENIASQIQTEINRYNDEPLPAIIPIPGVFGNTGIGMEQVSSFVERAVGSDIVN
ncbi:MAG: V-type ATP synthase subunit F [Eubacterium sp.]|nr:V-type ATP synthase subunit F [Eubacterium sp.]MBR6391833.1 V-type ATP synthase subunit F [Eubacterium sp.]MBR7072995.1 V-type ATP synthase subunit F [Eubacterium sp.]